MNTPCNKVCYHDKRAARSAINLAMRRRRNRPKALRMYWCGPCYAWHLTHTALKGAGARSQERGVRREQQNALRAAAAADPAACSCRMAMASVEADAAGGLPAEIMWMPGGTHTINATRNGKPTRLTVQVDRQTAATMQQALGRHLAASAHRPYLDLNHDDAEASGWVTGFAWRDGDLPGVYASVSWSEAGRAAITGRTYRAFSPQFYPDKSNPARVVGAPLNMGGLVNDPAFKAVAPLFAKRASASASNHKNDPMKKHKNLLALLATISGLQTERSTLAAKASPTDADKAAITAKDGEITTKLAEAKTLQGEVEAELAAASAGADHEAQLAAKDAEIELLQAQAKVDKAERDRLQGESVTAKRANAERQVEELGAGRIPPKNDILKKFWVDQFMADAVAAKAALEAVPLNPALRTVVKASAAGGAVLDFQPGAEGDVVAALEHYAGLFSCGKGRADVAATAQSIIAAKFFHKDLLPRANKGCDFVNEIAAIRAKLANDAYPVRAANSLGTLIGVLTLQRSLEFLHLNFPILNRISTDFSGEGAKWLQTIYTRIKGTLQAYDYDVGGAGTGYKRSQNVTTTDVPVVINKHKNVPVLFGVEELAKTMRNLFGEQDEPMNYAIGKVLVEELYALLTAANFSYGTAAGLAAFDRTVLVAMANVMNPRGVPDQGRTLLLNSNYFGKLSLDPAITALAQFQDKSLITTRTLPAVHGFTPVEAPNIAAAAQTATDHIVGAGFRPSALAMATRVPGDYTNALPGIPSTAMVQIVTNPNTGISVMLVQELDHTLGAAMADVRIMYGAAKGQDAALQLLTSQ